MMSRGEGNLMKRLACAKILRQKRDWPSGTESRSVW